MRPFAKRALAVGVALSAGLTVGISGSALASFPGENGRLTFDGSASNARDAVSRIWTAKPNGTALKRTGFGSQFTQLDDLFSPAWSSDGLRLAFESSEGIYVARPDAKTARFVVAHGQAPSWSPDSTRLAYLRQLGDYKSGTPHVVRLDGTGDHALGAPLKNAKAPTAVRWSPKQDLIAAVEDGQVKLFRPNGTLVRVVLSDPKNPPNTVDWAPDAKSLVVDYTPVGANGLQDNNAAAIFDVHGHLLKQLHLGADPVAPRISPDGHLILYEDGYNAYLHVTNIATGKTHRVPLPSYLAPFGFDWAPRVH